MKSILQLILILLLSGTAKAFEVDNFTDRYKPLKDSQEALDKAVNKAMDEALRSEKIAGCDKQKLRGAIKGALATSWVIGNFELLAVQEKTVEKNPSSNENSIYMYRSGKDKASGFMLTLVGLEPSINIDGHYIGVDKLGHFFDQGNDYFSMYQKEIPGESAIQRALDFGTKAEEGVLGEQTTGIKSYGDLAANYGGFLFWSSLTEGENPYFKCVSGSWKQARDFQWADYVTSAWDEAINCTDLRSPELKEAVTKRAKELEEADKVKGLAHRYQCPVSANECVKLRKSYGRNAVKILNPVCFRSMRNSEETDISAQKSAANGNRPVKNNSQSVPYGGVR